MTSENDRKWLKRLVCTPHDTLQLTFSFRHGQRCDPKLFFIFEFLLVPPRIVDFRPNPPLHSIRAGSSLTLSCRAEGTPMPQIRWRIRDVDVNRLDPCK